MEDPSVQLIRTLAQKQKRSVVGVRVEDGELIYTRRDGSEDNLGPVLSSAVRTATVVIAALDSSLKSKNGADYVCDGVADWEELQAAHDDLPAYGGSIELSEGNFTFADMLPDPTDIAPALTVTKPCVIRGQGEGTILDFSDNIQYASGSGESKVYKLFYIDIASNKQCVIQDMKIIGPDYIQGGSSHAASYAVTQEGGSVHVERVHCHSTGLRFRDPGAVASKVRFLGDIQNCIEVTHPQVILEDIVWGADEDTVLLCEYCIQAASGITDGLRVVDCLADNVESAFVLFDLDGDWFVFTGNRIGVYQPVTSTGDVIALLDGSGWAMADNIFGESCYPDTGNPVVYSSLNDAVVTNTFIYTNGTVEALEIVGLRTSYSKLMVDGGILVSNGDKNKLTDINMRSGDIKIGGVGAVDNLVAMNDFRLGGGVVNDLGTGTKLNYDGSANDWNLY